MPISSWSWMEGGSSRAARTRRCWPRPGSTPSWSRGNSPRPMRPPRSRRSVAPVLIAAPATLVLNERMIADDLVEPFEIEPFQLRGRLVRLGPTLDSIVKRHDYPPAGGTVLGEAIALAVALSSTLKYDGVFTLQTKGDGPIRLLVTDVTTGGAVRGYAQC